jgi:hypothetical protein
MWPRTALSRCGNHVTSKCPSITRPAQLGIPLESLIKPPRP